MAKKSKRYPGVPVEELEDDPHPEGWVDVKENGVVSHAMSFDRTYGPESQAQIDYWADRGYPGADEWEIGKPVGKVSDKTARDAMARHAHQVGRRA